MLGVPNYTTAVFSFPIKTIIIMSFQLKPPVHKRLKIMSRMNKLKSILVIVTILASALPLMAQKQRVSPHETISSVIDGNRVTIVYGRPYTKDPKTGEPRKIWGGLLPY